MSTTRSAIRAKPGSRASVWSPFMSVSVPLPLTPAEIHLWLASSDEGSEELHSAYREILDDSERERELRFHFAADRRRYRLTRALVRTVLSRYVPVRPRDWVFAANAYGRPEIANPQGRAARLSFNVSHTQGLIVLGVTQD